MKHVMLLLCMLGALLSCVRAEETTTDVSVAELSVRGLFARHGLTKAVSGTFQDTVTRPNDEEAAEPNVLNVSFWLERPNKYHFRVQESDSEDSQHYVSDGISRWEVEVVLDTEIVDKKKAKEDDPFARIQKLMHLDEAGLAKDFEWTAIVPFSEIPDLAASPKPKSWVNVLVLTPHSPDMRSEVKRVVVAFSAENDLAGLLIDDSHGNRRLVEVTRLTTHDALDPSYFTWGDQ